MARTIEIPGYQRPHGMAFLPGDTLLAVTDESNKAVLLIDFRTGALSRVLPTNSRLTHMLSLSADGGTMVTANIAEGTISVIRPSGTDSTVTIRVAAAPEGIAWAFVTLQGRNRVITIDLDSARIVGWAPTGTWSDGIGYSPLVSVPQ